MKNTRDAGLKAGGFVDAKKGTLDINDIHKIIPHRVPFLFVDKVIEIEGNRAVGIKTVTGGEEFFKGHFPGRPIMPGVLMLEAIAQLGGIFLFSKKENLSRLAYFVGMDDVRFRKAVIPGDVLRLEVGVIKIKSRIAQLQGTAQIESEVAAEAKFLFGFTDSK